jgi:hypothetical protein
LGEKMATGIRVIRMTKTAENAEVKEIDIGDLTSRLFGNLDEVIIDDTGFIYCPVLMNDSVNQEIEENPNIISLSGKKYIKTNSFDGILEIIKQKDPEQYKDLRREVLRKLLPRTDFASVVPNDDFIRKVIFNLLPRFLSVEESQTLRPGSDEDILKLIQKKYNVPSEFYQKAKSSLEIKELEEIVGRLKDISEQRIPSGRLNRAQLIESLKKVIENRIIREEKINLSNEANLRKEIVDRNVDNLATLSYLKSLNEFEIGKFGFLKVGANYGAGKDYVVYAKTGDYILQHFNGDYYFFSSCRVGVRVNENAKTIDAGISDPIVIESYSHPFLSRDDSPGSTICIATRGNIEYDETGKRIVKTLEERIINQIDAGLRTIMCGYISKNIHPYRWLDDSSLRGNRISNKDKRITEGKVPVTNAPFVKDIVARHEEY